MIKYDSEDHYRFHNVKVGDKERMILYFKRVPIEQDSNDNIYAGLNQLIMKERIEQTKEKIEPGKPLTSALKMDQGELPKNRTLIIMNFDSPFDRKFVAKVFKLCGLTRRVFVGSLKVQDGQKKRLVHVGLVVFKNEYDLTKCFNIEYFQNRIYQKFKTIPLTSNYEKKLLQQYEIGDNRKDQIVQEALNEGYKIVTNKSGDFEVNLNQPIYQKRNWALQKQKKIKQEINQEEIEAVIEGFEDKLPKQKKKDVLRLEKQRLQEEFELDRQKLKQKKLQ